MTSPMSYILVVGAVPGELSGLSRRIKSPDIRNIGGKPVMSGRLKNRPVRLLVTGPGMVIHAIAAGRRGALAIDKYLKEDTSPVHLYNLKSESFREPVPEAEEQEEWKAEPRSEMPILSPDERKTCFDEIELGFSEERAQYEARRCLRCDLET